MRLVNAQFYVAILCLEVQELHKRYWVGGVKIVARQQAHPHAATQSFFDGGLEDVDTAPHHKGHRNIDTRSGGEVIL